MRYPRGRKQQTRDQILDEAARAFRAQGVAQVSIGDLMQRLGLTHGGFYTHFPSKDALVAEACLQALAQAADTLFPLDSDLDPKGRLAQAIRGYLSRDHRDTPATGCLIPALAGEIAHESGHVRHGFTEALCRYVERIALVMGGGAGSGETGSGETGSGQRAAGSGAGGGLGEDGYRAGGVLGEEDPPVSPLLAQGGSDAALLGGAGVDPPDAIGGTAPRGPGGSPSPSGEVRVDDDANATGMSMRVLPAEHESASSPTHRQQAGQHGSVAEGRATRPEHIRQDARLDQSLDPAAVDRALVLVAGMAGIVLLARAVDDTALSDRLLLAGRRFYTESFAAGHARPASQQAGARISSVIQVAAPHGGTERTNRE